METARAGQLGAIEDCGVFDLARALYDAAVDPARWAVRLGNLCDVLGSKACGVARFNFRDRAGSISCSAGFDLNYLRLYRKTYSSHDIWFQREEPYRSPGVILTSEDLISGEDLVRSEFYRDWMKPQGFFYRVCAVLERDADNVAYFMACRSQLAGAYADREVGVLRALLPHFQRAFQVYQRITQLQAERHAAVEALNHLPLGVAVVSGEGKLLACNRRARDLLRRADGIAEAGGALRTANPATTFSLHALIAEAAARNSDNGMRSSHVMSISRPSGLRPLSVLVCPLPPANLAIEQEEHAAILFIGDPEHHEATNESWLHELYGLTPTESRLTTLIAQGDSISEAAERLGISVGTARVHLKHVFSKTGTNRQAELVHLVVTGPTLLAAS